MHDTPLLAGLKVIDAGSFIAAPAAATVMADLGADVIKLEPPAGDPFRHLRHAPGNPPCEVDYGWLADNRNKRGLVLDLKTEAGRGVLYRLIRDTDVFVTNLPLPARERLGIGYEDLAPHNERLIYASLTAYGERGPERFNTGFDSTALWARSGLMDMVRPAPDSPPAKSLPGMGDHPTAITLYAAIATALYRREQTGRGGYVATNLMANGLWWNALHAQAMLCGAEFARRPGREDAPSALHNFYRTADGRWLQLVVIPEDKRWPRLARAIGRPDLIEDPRFAAREDRHAHHRALIRELDEAFATAPLAEWRRRLADHVVAYGVISTLRDIPEDRQMHESGALAALDRPGRGSEVRGIEPALDRRRPAGAAVAPARDRRALGRDPQRARLLAGGDRSAAGGGGPSRARPRRNGNPLRSPIPLERAGKTGKPLAPQPTERRPGSSDG